MVVVLAAALLVSGTRPAQAHVPIVLLVLAPKAGQTVTPNPEVVIYAQRMLGGTDQVTYTLVLDQRPLDPASGRTAPAPQPGQIRAGQQVRVPLHDLGAGQHRLTLTYRPDRDAPGMGATVAFTVRPGPAGVPVVPLAVGGLGLVAVAGITASWARHRRRALRAAR